MQSPPESPKIYHILHVDRLPSVIQTGSLLCDAEIRRRGLCGTSIGMENIKERRLSRNLETFPDLFVGGCVPFYFCPRSVMLYVLHRGNHSELGYRGGQGPIIHLEADLHKTVDWANANGLRWVFTLSNAGSFYFEERSRLTDLSDLNWSAIQAKSWEYCREGKQAEFLFEKEFPLQLVERIGVFSPSLYTRVCGAFRESRLKPAVQVLPDWYY